MNQWSWRLARLGIGRPVSPASTLWWTDRLVRSGSPEQDDGPVVDGDRSDLVDDHPRAPAEPTRHQPLGRAQEPVDPDRKIAPGSLDQAVGVKQQRVIGAKLSLDDAERRVGQQPEHRALELLQPPATTPAGVVGDRRMTGRREAIVA